MRDLWPLATAIVVRIGVWLLVSPTRFASDEDSYHRVGTTLLTSGTPDVFWPPVTGWLVALTAWVFDTASPRAIRLAWIAMDIGCLLAVRALARRIADGIFHADTLGAARFTTLATFGYALYLPAISFSQFTTSETPALLFLLVALVALARPHVSTAWIVLAGLLTGVVAITRPSLLPLIAFLPAAAALHARTRTWLIHAAVFVVAASAVVGGIVLRNYALTGTVTIAENSAYNLYIGNRDLYAEDLDLFHPVATAGQIEFRRQYFSGELTYPTGTAAELQREALDWIAAHPREFARRAVGRLARVFAPKTDVLELLGGERAAGIFSLPSLTLLGLTNLQWVVVLFGGLVGLAGLWRLQPQLGGLFAATLLGSLPLCLIAISKPRYAFPFEPLLLLGAVLLIVAHERVLAALTRRDRWIIAAVAAFLIWGWAAWLVFAVTSRVALAGSS